MDEKEKKFNQREYEKQWHKENYGNINLRISKDIIDQIKDHAKKMGESTNGFLKRAALSTIEQDIKNNPEK